MGNYFNELRLEIIRANNLLQFIHQPTIEFRFRKFLALERFKSNFEFRYQINVSSLRFRKGFAEFMMPIKACLRLETRIPLSFFTEGVHIRHNDYHLMHILQQRSWNTDMPLGQRSNILKIYRIVRNENPSLIFNGGCSYT